MLNRQSIQELISSQNKDAGLHQSFFVNKEVFDLSYEALFHKQWIFVTHLSHFTENTEFIYNLNQGHIEINRLENGNLDIQHSIKNAPCHLRVHESLVFINLSKDPFSFDEFITPLAPYIKIHGLNDGKIAFQKEYIFNASHMATIQNFKECNHCWGGNEFSHKDYLNVHGAEYCNSYGAGVGSGVESDSFDQQIQDWSKENTKRNIFVGEFVEDNPLYFRIAERTPLQNDFLSETKDGQYCCSKLMGDFEKIGPDKGYTAIGFSPFNSFIANNEFVVLFIFTPVETNKTIITQMWITHKDAECDIEKMIWLWDRTTQEDQMLCEMNQKGIESRFYRQGKYGKLEKSLVQYQEFYLNHLQNHLNDLV